jgi:hypothetical protein
LHPRRRIPLLLLACSLGVLASQEATATGPDVSATPGDAGGLGMASPAVLGESATSGPSVEAPSPIPSGLHSPSDVARCYLLIPVRRSGLESPQALDAALAAANAAGLRVVVRLEDEEPSALLLPPGGTVAGLPVEDWIAKVGNFARRAGNNVSAYQIFTAPARGYSPRDYAYRLKRAAVAIRSAGHKVRIVSGALGADDAEWTRRLFAADAAPYVDVLAAAGPSSLPAVLEMRDTLHPRASVWVTDAEVDPEAPRASVTRAYLEAYARRAEVILFSAAPPKTAPGLGDFLAWLRSQFPPGLVPGSAAALPFDAGAATWGPEAGARAEIEALAFFDTARREGIAAYRSPSSRPERRVHFRMKTPVESLELIDPETGTAAPIAPSVPAGGVIFVPVRADHLLLRYRVPVAVVPVQESVKVGAAVGLSAEEIIALERQFRAAQEARLRHYEARAVVALHYRIALVAESIDVVSDNRLYVQDGRQDYEQTDLRVDGVRWRGKTPPHLPFLQPDKVKEVPLDIALDEGYRYELLGRERVDGRDCYVLAFEPIAKDRSLYEGRVHIDSVIFARVRMEAVQNGLKEPLRSNRVTYRFAPVGPAGEAFWLPTEVKGQMVFEVLGQNLVVEREATYSEFAINQEGFGERVRGALASGRPIFRDTEEGFYRVEARDGQEQLESVGAPRNVFLVVGASAGFDGEPGFPFAGVNFFDFDFKGSGTQFDLAWAGPFADISWTDPALTHPAAGRRPVALTLQGTLSALPRRDKNARSSGTDSGETVEILSESVRGAVALPMGHFAKWTLEARATYMNFSTHDDTDETFILPPTSTEGSLGLRLEFNRSGYIASAWGEAARRSDWKAWGLPGSPFDPEDRDFTRIGLELKKAFYLGTARKLNFGLSGFLGRGLDRFSRFELGDFRSARVRGFNGSGIHFDRGAIAEAAYSFTIGQGLRVDASLGQGWIEGEDDFGPGYERVLGAGLGLQFSGPWSTLVNVRLSRGLDSTIPDKGGGGDMRVTFFRTFDRWSRRPRT